MLPKQLLNLVNSIEEKNNINYTFMGVDLWPVLRTSFVYAATRVNFNQRKKPLVLWDSIVSFFFSLKSLLYVGKGSELLLTSLKFSEILGSQYVHKDFFAFHGCNGWGTTNSLCVITQSPVTTFKNGECGGIYSLIVVSSVLARICTFLSLSGCVKNYVNKCARIIEQEINQKQLSFSKRINPKILIRNIFFVLVASCLLEKLLKKVNPQRCYVVCYYSLLGMALCVACHKLNIPVADIQHGVSGRYSKAYGGWKRVPKNGYNTLPSEFLCWTDYDKSAIDEWAIQCEGRHRAKVCGNLWRHYLTRKGTITIDALKKSVFNNTLDRFEKIISVTLNCDELNDHIQKLLRMSPKQYCYLIRVHPDFKNNDMTKIENYLRDYNKNVFVKQVNSLKIQELMRISDVNISEWSASVYDAYFEGLISIVITEIGRDYYEDFIKDGMVIYCAKPDETLAAITSI